MVLEADHLALVKQLLAHYVPDIDVWAFGSRVQGNPKPHSDLDLALVSERPLPINVLAQLSHAFEESDLPIRVDLVELHKVDPAFRAVIERQHEVIQRRSSSQNP